MIEALFLAFLLVVVVLPLTPVGLAEARYVDAGRWCVWVWQWGGIAVLLAVAVRLARNARTLTKEPEIGP